MLFVYRHKNECNKLKYLGIAQMKVIILGRLFDDTLTHRGNHAIKRFKHTIFMLKGQLLTFYLFVFLKLLREINLTIYLFDFLKTLTGNKIHVLYMKHSCSAAMTPLCIRI